MAHTAEYVREQWLLKHGEHITLNTNERTPQEEKVQWLLSHGIPSMDYKGEYPALETREEIALGIARYYDENMNLAPTGYQEAFGDLKLVDKLSKAGIPQRFLYRFWDNQNEVDSCVQNLFDGKNIYIYGDVGVRKTTLACCIVRELIKKNSYAVFTSVTDILNEIHASNELNFSALNKYKNADFLVLDDFGKETLSEFNLSKVFELIDARNKNLLPIVITTQYKGSELIGKLSENGSFDTAKAIVSRLRQYSTAIELTGADYRTWDEKEKQPNEI